MGNRILSSLNPSLRHRTVARCWGRYMVPGWWDVMVFIVPRRRLVPLVPHSEEAGRQYRLWRPCARQVRPGAGAHADAGRPHLQNRISQRRYAPLGARASIQYFCQQGTILYSLSITRFSRAGFDPRTIHHSL